MFNRFFLGPLFEPADPDAGAGGGGDPAPPDHLDPNAGDPPPEINEALLNALLSRLTEAMKPMVTDSVSSAVNPAIARIDRDLKGLKKTIAPAAPLSSPQDETARERELREKLEQEQLARREEREQVEARELDAEIKAAIAALPFADPEGKSVAFDFYKAKAARDEDGNLVIGDKPLATYIQGHASRVFDKFMQVRQNVGGSGNATNRNSTVKGFSIDSIRPGMSAEDDAAARAALAAALAERGKRF